MAYKYRLETVLTVRENREEQVKLKLSHELNVLENHRQHLGDLRRQRQHLIDSFEEKKADVISGKMFSFYVESISNQEREIEFNLNTIKAQEQAVEQVRAELEEKVKDKRIVERMKEKDYEEYLKENGRKEQNEHDEMAILRFSQEQIL